MATLRRILDGLYLGGGYLAALALVAIVVLIVVQWGARVQGVTFSVGSVYAGYAMAAASFFGFAYALNHDAHIRVTLLLGPLRGRGRWLAEVWCFAFGAAVTTWFAYHAIDFTYDSWRFNFLSDGADATPLWIPQALMCAGALLFATCFWDNLLTLLVRGRSNVVETTLDEGDPATLHEGHGETPAEGQGRDS